MSEVAIRMAGLSKAYRLPPSGTRARYHTLREDVASLPARFRNLRRGRQADGDTLWAIRDVSYEVREGEVLGIVGRNGAGKSTLLKVLARITEPTSGQAEVYGRIGSLLEVGTGFHPELTGRENIYLSGAVLGMRRQEVKRKFEAIVAFAEVERFVDTPAKHYSSGMYMRLAFAVAAHLEPEILLIDEVLAVGDAAFQKKCLGKMDEVARRGRTVLFVSHNMAAVKSLCQNAVLIERGRIKLAGAASGVVEAYLSDVPVGEVTFAHGPIRRLTVRQVDQHIELAADYECDPPLSFPSLGFVISDWKGDPIIGSNPVIDGVTRPPTIGRSGSVHVTVTAPALRSGTYRVSIWLGDGQHDFFEARDCVSLEITNLTSLRPLPPEWVGPVVPHCEWRFH